MRWRAARAARAASDGKNGKNGIEGDAVSTSSSGSKSQAALGCALACLITLQQGLDVSVAFADDVNGTELSSYERRKLENERRKEMLRSLREKAERGASSVDTTPVAPPPQAASPKPTVPTIPADTPKLEAPRAPKSDEMKMPSFSVPKLPSLGGNDDTPGVKMPSFSVPKLPSLGGNDDTPGVK
ncbi:MAG: hypothetical protein ABGY24_11635, partial [bacterium]